MKKSTKDILVIGFALFAMFFGAGNLIFPPYLGKIVGSKFYIAAVGFIITGVGIPFLGIISCTKTNGSFETMASRVGKKFAVICATALFLAIGPMLAIPRTAATTHELTLKPLFPGISPLTSMIIYFALNLCFVLKPSKIIDNIGKYLTPALLITLLILIIKGIVFPIGQIADTNQSLVFSNSLLEGYQTMDALAALVFSSIITASVVSKGYEGKDVINLTLKAGSVAIVGLAIVYGGLMYLGAQTSSLIPGEISKTTLLLEISQRSLGSLGTILIGVAIGLACFTTSVGLITAGSDFFHKTSNGKLPYKLNAIAISLASILIGSLGVDKIVAFAVPILSILYPVAITLIVTTLLGKYAKDDFIVRVSVYTALLFSILGILPSLGLNIALLNSIMNRIPLYTAGFGWVIPTILAFILTSSVRKLNYKPSEVN